MTNNNTPSESYRMDILDMSKLNTTNSCVIGKGRRTGFNLVMDREWSNLSPTYNIRTSCENLLKELHRYYMTQGKLAFTKEEESNIVIMLKSKDLYTLETLRQIILTKMMQ
jgi:hypothetical protein